MRATAHPKIKQYTDKRTGKPRYLVRYRKPDGTQTMKRGFTTKRDAEAWLNEVEGSKLRGEFVAVSAGRVTLESMAGPWLAAKQRTVKPTTFEGIETAWTIHIRPTFGAVPLYRIRTSDVEAWVTELAGRKSATVVRRAHAALAQMLDTAVRDRRITVNPARGVTLPRVQSRAHRYLSHVEVKRVADHAGKYAPLVYVLAYGGLRWGEAVALRGGDIDGARVRIDRAVTHTKAGWIVGTPKTHHRRTLYLPSFVAKMLPAAEPGQLLFPPARGEYLSTPGKTQRGKKGWWERALEAAGVEYLRIHDLRHTAASLAIQSGAHVKALQRMLGHSSAAVTLDVYSGLFDSDLDAVAGSLDAARAAAVPEHEMHTDDREATGTMGNGGAVIPLRR